MKFFNSFLDFPFIKGFISRDWTRFNSVSINNVYLERAININVRIRLFTARKCACSRLIQQKVRDIVINAVHERQTWVIAYIYIYLYSVIL